MNTKTKLFASIGLIAFMVLGAIGVNQLMAQTEANGGDDKKKVEKKIEIVEDNGESKMTVTTTTNGVTTTQTFVGDEIDDYLEKEAHVQIKGLRGDAKHNFVKINTTMVSDDEEVGNFEFSFDDETLSMLKKFEQMDKMNEDEADEILGEFLENIGNISINIDVDNEDAKHIKIGSDDKKGTMKVVIKSDEEASNGKSVNKSVKIMVIGDDDKDGSIEEIIETMQSTMNIEVNVDSEDGDHENVEKITITTKSSDEDEDDASASLDLKAFNYYPNPSTGKFKVDVELANGKAAKLSITDLQGKEVYKAKISGKGTQTQDIDISEHGSGVYFLHIKQGKKSTSKRIVVE